MINIVLFNDESVIRIATKAINYLSNSFSLRITKDAIWIDGLYLRFYDRLITLNDYSSAFSKKDIINCLNYILSGEEVFISNDNQNKIYISVVNASTNFDEIFCGDVV